MRPALALYAVLVLLLAPPLLRGRAWVDRAPSLGILAWQASGIAVLGSLLLLGVTTVVPVSSVDVDLSHLLHACAVLLHADDVGLSDAALLAGAAGLTALLGVRGWRTIRGSAGLRGRQRELVDLVTVPMSPSCPRVRLLDHAMPLAYCIPGRRGRIVVTTGAREALGQRELAAVLAHEQAHLHGRHHLVLLWARVACAALPLSLFRAGERETAELVEMLADDTVRSRAARRSLAVAVLTLGVAHPAGALGADARHGTAQRRVRRLLSPSRQLAQGPRAAVLALCLSVALGPWLATAPALAALSGQCFPST